QSTSWPRRSRFWDVVRLRQRPGRRKPPSRAFKKWRNPVAENRIKQLYEREGQSVWQDDISRDMLNRGDIRSGIEEIGIRGLTSHPTIFEKAIAAGTAYDDEIAVLLERDLETSAIFETVAVHDIQAACDLFRQVYDAAEGRDGFVSIEVSPLSARNG